MLYLITRALERHKDIPVLGLERDHGKLKRAPGLDLIISKGAKKARTSSTTHGGFDNDANTMNSVMKRILGAAPPLPFKSDELTGF